MPRVPTVDGPSVALQGVDSKSAYQTTPQALGQAGMVRAQQLGQVAQAAGQYADMRQKQQNRDDIDVVFRAETALKDDYIKFEREELGKQGANAKGASERANQWWNEAQAKYGEGLTERQAHAFRRSAAQIRLSSTSTLGRHEQHQANESLKESAQARIGTAVSMAVGDPTPERLATSKKEIIEAVNIAGGLEGYTPEILQAKQTEALTLMHRGVVMQFADRDPDAAKAYFYTNKKEIDGATQVTLEKTLERSGLLQKAQDAADEIMVKFPDIGAAMAHIEKTYSGETEREIKAQVASRYTTVKAAKNEMSQNAYETALLHTVRGQKVPAAVWSQMDDGHKAAIIEKQEAEAKARRAEAEGKPVKTDFATWDKINRLVTDDPKAFASLDVGRYADRLSRADMEEFGKVQRKVREGGDGAKDIVTLQQQIGTTIDQLRLTGADNTERRGKLEHTIVEAVRREQRVKGKPLTDEERQKVIDRQIIDVSIPGFIWDTKKKAYEVEGTPDAVKAKIVVPDADRKLIADALKTMGRTADDAEILATYKRQKGLR